MFAWGDKLHWRQFPDRSPCLTRCSSEVNEWRWLSFRHKVLNRWRLSVLFPFHKNEKQFCAIDDESEKCGNKTHLIYQQGLFTIKRACSRAGMVLCSFCGATGSLAAKGDATFTFSAQIFSCLFNGDKSDRTSKKKTQIFIYLFIFTCVKKHIWSAQPGIVGINGGVETLDWLQSWTDFWFRWEKEKTRRRRRASMESDAWDMRLATPSF